MRERVDREMGNMVRWQSFVQSEFFEWRTRTGWHFVVQLAFSRSFVEVGVCESQKVGSCFLPELSKVLNLRWSQRRGI